MTRAGTQSSGATVREAPASGPGRRTSEGLTGFSGRVKAEVEDRLAAWLNERVTDAGRRRVDGFVVADAVRHFTLRGVKLMRPGMLALADVGFGFRSGRRTVAP